MNHHARPGLGLLFQASRVPPPGGPLESADRHGPGTIHRLRNRPTGVPRPHRRYRDGPSSTDENAGCRRSRLRRWWSDSSPRLLWGGRRRSDRREREPRDRITCTARLRHLEAGDSVRAISTTNVGSDSRYRSRPIRTRGTDSPDRHPSASAVVIRTLPGGRSHSSDIR